MAKVAVRQSRRQAELAETTYRTALLALRRQLNPPAGESLALIGRLGDFIWLPVAAAPAQDTSDPWAVVVPDAQAADLASRRPDVLAAQFGVGVAQANTNLARANQIQNIALGPFYERTEDGTVLAGFRGQVNIPIWDNGRPLTAQRRAEQNLQWVTLNQLHARAQVEARTAIERYERARRVLQREGVGLGAPLMDQLQSIKDQFASGQADILNVYSVQNSLLQEQRADLDLLNEVAQAAADVTLLAGLPPAHVVTTRCEDPPQPDLLPAQ